MAANSYSYIDCQQFLKEFPFVDLGLPSGTLWAEMNIGASSVTDIGDHYPWGETTLWYSSLSDDWYFSLKPEYSNGFTQTVYNSSSNMKNTNASLTGEYAKYDVAAVTYGSGCHIPSVSDFNELKANCYWRHVESYSGAGVKGLVVFKANNDSHKGKITNSSVIQPFDASYTYDMPHVFIPYNGYGMNDRLKSGGLAESKYGVLAGYYWLSDNETNSIGFNQGIPIAGERPRYLALGIRAVKDGEQD